MSRLVNVRRRRSRRPSTVCLTICISTLGMPLMCNNHPDAVMTPIRDICDSDERYQKPLGRYREDLAIAVMTHMIPLGPTFAFSF
jgi:hypothetical protein